MEQEHPGLFEELHKPALEAAVDLTNERVKLVFGVKPEIKKGAPMARTAVRANDETRILSVCVSGLDLICAW